MIGSVTKRRRVAKTRPVSSPFHRRRGPLAAIVPVVMSAALVPLSITASAAPMDPLPPLASGGSRTPDAVVCDGPRALSRDGASGLPLLVGRCGGSPDTNAPPTAGGAMRSGAAGPADCVVPGYDDHCEAWAAARYDGPWSGGDYPGFGSFNRVTTILPHPTGDLLFVGGTSTTPNGADADFVAIAYRASTGQPVWTQTFQGLGERTLAYGESIALSPGGDTLYVLGQVAEPGVYIYSAAVVAFDSATGRRLWEQSYPFSVNTLATAETYGDGALGLYGAGSGGVTLEDGKRVSAGVVVSIDPSDGALLWRSDFPGTSPTGARFNDLVVAPDGSTLYAGGGEHRPDGLAVNFATVAFRATDGARLWEARDALTQPNGFFGNNGISDMAVTPDGSRVIVNGFDSFATSSFLDPSYSALLTIAHDAATGGEAWRRSYYGPVEGERHFYFSLFQPRMAVTADGATVVVTGDLGQYATGTVAYDVVSGSQRWGIESDDGVAPFSQYLGYYSTLAMGKDTVFVTNKRGFGYATHRTVTTAYALANGDQLWMARLGGIGRTLPGGSVSSPDGERVFVAASDHTHGVTSWPVPNPGLDTPDILTVAYDAS